MREEERNQVGGDEQEKKITFWGEPCLRPFEEGGGEDGEKGIKLRESK